VQQNWSLIWGSIQAFVERYWGKNHKKPQTGSPVSGPRFWRQILLNKKQILRSDKRSSSGQSSWLQNGDVLCFLWGTNRIYICYVEESRPPLWSSGQSTWIQNGDVLCFVWGMNWIYVCYIEESRQPLWSNDQSSWLQIQRSGFDPGATTFSEK
jgi:hypothetical protein